jgi:hypothetical protein
MKKAIKIELSGSELKLISQSICRSANELRELMGSSKDPNGINLLTNLELINNKILDQLFIIEKQK